MHGKNRHHLWFPASSYRNGIWRQLRNLPCMVVMIDEEAHKQIHLHSAPPTKPCHSEAFDLVVRHNQRLCSCHRSGEKG